MNGTVVKTIIPLLVLSVYQTCAWADDWGSITITPVEDSFEVVLENSQFRAVYKKSPNNWAHRHPTCMVEFHYKKIGRELIENGRWDDILDPLDHSKKPARPKYHYREKMLSARYITDSRCRLQQDVF